ncbi:hypothetical protein JTE90_024485 [Oedothorax gibbosus]|uniref:Uncharacterized protein n=1 Tax=Oedothorax gibbosus TaxID=931172 RepID=A0AAV6TGG4_9ARAC|nr:hypothetical protein JTE90_027058 [Oedothorax gibbosus]KAG8170833.1 hypothetical protein JTE90_028921 [Oedothorax gibbosus]KAG8172434.1 hypothetical protein JTE90_024484 [Oedothorax gibbosus]KAG8172435.1 hypothetical protein JTE90_024485 [Oedothorax gibbosus]
MFSQEFEPNAAKKRFTPSGTRNTVLRHPEKPGYSVPNEPGVRGSSGRFNILLERNFRMLLVATSPTPGSADGPIRMATASEPISSAKDTKHRSTP